MNAQGLDTVRACLLAVVLSVLVGAACIQPPASEDTKSVGDYRLEMTATAPLPEGRRPVTATPQPQDVTTEDFDEEEIDSHDEMPVPTVSPTPEPIVGPLGRAVGAATECSSEVPGIDETAIAEVHGESSLLPLDQLRDSATVIVHARGLTREQVNVPVSDPRIGGSEQSCWWVVFAEVEAMEYLKGQGPHTLRVALPVAKVPRPYRPVAIVEGRHDIEVGLEYVLFLRSDRPADTRGLSGRTWTVLLQSQGRWPVEDERLLTGLGPPQDEMTLGELRSDLLALGPAWPPPGPLGRAVSAATGCSSYMAEPGQDIVVEVNRDYVQFTLDELIDRAAAIVHAKGVSSEQVKVPESDTDDCGSRPICRWVVFVEVEVMEYLKGDGPDMLLVAVPVANVPNPGGPLVNVESGQDIVVGLEYVLFLGNRRFPDTWGLSGRYWTLMGRRQGRWLLEGGTHQYTGMEPTIKEIPIDELRALISPSR